MNLKSVRFRLSLWYFVTFFVSAAVVFSIFYVVTKQTLLAQTDQEITQHGEQIVDLIAQQSVGMHTSFPQEQLSREFSEMPGMLIVIANRNGEILSSSQIVESSTKTLKDVFEKSANLINSSFIELTIGTTHMRVGIFPVSTNENTDNLVLVGHPTDVITDSLNKLSSELVLIFGIASVLSLIGGLIISKKALQPVTQLSLKLKEISLSNLSQPIHIFKTGDELEELSTSFNSLLTRLSDSFTRERQFIGDVAHELRTPLSTLKNSIEVTLSKDRTAKEYQHTLNETLVDVDHLSGTVNDVLDLAWSESDKPLLNTERVDLSEMLGELVDITKKMAEAKQIYVIEEIKQHIEIAGKRQKLFRAFFNLLENAVKYTPEKGRISVTLSRTKSSDLIEITNTGPGISKADLPHVFDRFYRGGKKVTTFGSGLGLAICKSIIEAHRGTITIESTPKKVTTIMVNFPR